MTRAFAVPSLLLLCLLTCLYAVPARGEALEYGGLKLDLRPPANFVDVTESAADLVRATQAEAVPDGVLLRLYLPDDAAQRYAEGRPDELTRQVSVYAARDGENLSLDKKALELMARSLEGAYTGYAAVPDETLKDGAALDVFLREAIAEGTSLLLSPIRADHAEGRVVMQVFGADAPVAALMATALVLVDDKVLFVTASSLATGNSPADDAAWVAAAAEAFADALASAAKK